MWIEFHFQQLQSHGENLGQETNRNKTFRAIKINEDHKGRDCNPKTKDNLNSSYPTQYIKRIIFT